MYITVPQFCRMNPAFSRSTLYKLISNADKNGLDKVIVRIPLTSERAKKIVFKESDMMQWLKSRKEDYHE